MRARPLLFAVSMTIACTPVAPALPPDDSTAPEPAEPEIEPTPEPVGLDDAAVTARPPMGPPSAERFAAIGASCAEVPDGVRAECDEAGIAVALSAPVDTVPDIPWDQIQVIHEATGLDRGGSIKVGHVGDRLWIQHVACGICRRIIGVAIVADLDRLDDAQRRRIQDEAGVPTEPVLQTVDDWRRTLAPQ